MTNRTSLAAALVAALASAAGSPAIAADGAVLITHTKALAGNITPGDPPGYPITLSKTGCSDVQTASFTPRAASLSNAAFMAA